MHGIEILEPGRTIEATTYTGPESGVVVALNRGPGSSIHVQNHRQKRRNSGSLRTCQAIASHSMGNQSSRHSGGKFSLIFCATRRAHVDIIPGDRRISLRTSAIPKIFDVLS